MYIFFGIGFVLHIFVSRRWSLVVSHSSLAVRRSWLACLWGLSIASPSDRHCHPSLGEAGIEWAGLKLGLFCILIVTCRWCFVIPRRAGTSPSVQHKPPIWDLVRYFLFGGYIICLFPHLMVHVKSIFNLIFTILRLILNVKGYFWCM